MLTKDLWIEVFKAGTHTDSAGNVRDWTTDDIDTMVALYNNQPDDTKHEAPVVIGHPEDDSPAYGWVAELKRDGDILLARLKDLAPEFVEWVQKGLYKKRSISVYSDLLLKHVGFLGGVPPAVKGLADPQFNHGEKAIVIEFDEVEAHSIENQENISQKNNTAINKFNNLKYNQRSINMSEDRFNLLLADLITWLADTFGEEVANQTNGFLDANRGKYVEVAPVTNESNSSETNSGSIQEPTTHNHSEDPRVKELELQVAQLQRANREKDFRQYVEKLIKEEGKLLPKQADYAMALLELGHSAGKHQFAEQGKVKEVEAVLTVKNFLESFDRRVDVSPIPEGSKINHDYSEFAGLNVDEERLALDRKVQTFIAEQLKQGKIINYLDALNIVTKEKEL